MLCPHCGKVIILELSPRESEILKLIARGGSNKSIARALGISSQTVKNIVMCTFRKLNAKNRAHAVTIGIGLGVISLKEEQDEG